MEWFFPSNNGGQENGFHDAWVETFKGNIDRYIARESIQNCIDARSDYSKPVRVVFDLTHHNAESIPEADALSSTLISCGKYWKSDKKAKVFFNKALAILKSDLIPVLRIGDYNTSGVRGSDTERAGEWYNLVKCAGSSSKGSGEGGSFGIGKGAPFAASALRTVFYSTFNQDKESIFQGVARVTTHEDAKGDIVQATGFLGSEKGASIRDKGAIPSKFRRSEQGTDIHVLGYQAGEQWESDLIHSVLENFWPAIHRADLTVEVAGTIIDKSNLPRLMEKYAAEKDFTAHLYFRASVSPDAKAFSRELKHLGDVSLHLLPGDFGLPKKIALARKTGMVIQHKAFRSLIPFVGYFLCSNKAGNDQLRDMEPPKHDTWDKDLPEKNSGKKALDELFDWMRDCINKLRPSDDSTVISVPDLYKFLPDEEESELPGLDTEPEGAKEEETAEKIPKEIAIVTRPILRQASASVPDSQSDEMDNEFPDRIGDHPGQNNEPGGGNGGDGSGGSGGNQGENDIKEVGGGGGKNPKPPLPIRCRAFVYDPTNGIYRLVVVPQVTRNGTLAVCAVGDDARPEPLDLESAFLTDGSALQLVQPNQITGVILKENEVLRLDVKLKKADRLSLQIFAYEA